MIVVGRKKKSNDHDIKRTIDTLEFKPPLLPLCTQRL